MTPALPPPLPPPSAPPSSSPSSCFFDVRCTLTIHLHPSFLSNVDEGVNSHLNSLLLRYHPHVRGVILLYSSVRRLTQSGAILFERPFIHFPISVSFLVFRVDPHQLVEGVVAKVGHDHLNLLVHGHFPAQIHREHLPPHFKYSRAVEVRPGRTEPMMVDTRVAGGPAPSAALPEGGELSKKAQAKLKKAAEKEERRAAYLATHGSGANGVDGSMEEEGGEDPLRAHIRMGSVLLFRVLEVYGAESLFTMEGSLTAEGAQVRVGELVKLRAMREREAEEERERLEMEEKEANSVEHLFGQEDDVPMLPPPSQPPVQAKESPALNGRVSKKELKEQRRVEKAERKAAKALRRQQRKEGGGAAAVTRDAEEREEEEEEEVGDSQGGNVVDNADFSHIDEHRLMEDEEEARPQKKRPRPSSSTPQKADVSSPVKKKRKENRQAA